MTLNRYKGIFKNMSQKSVVAMDAKSAAGLLMVEEQSLGLLTTLQLLEQGILVETPPLFVDFEAYVTPSLAIVQGAWASPSKWRVPVGESVLFEVRVPDGFTFAGWYINSAAEPISNSTIAELVIPESPSPDAIVKIEARLVAVP